MHPHIVDITALARDEALVFLSCEPCADSIRFHHVSPYQAGLRGCSIK
jgi:hypothetical protein